MAKILNKKWIDEMKDEEVLSLVEEKRALMREMQNYTETGQIM